MLADRSLYLDRTRTRLVGETDPEVAWLLVWKGREIPAEDVKRLGLVEREGRVVQPSQEPNAAPEPTAVMPAAAVETTPDAPATPAPAPIIPPQVRRGRRRN